MDLVKSWYCSLEGFCGEPLMVLRTMDGRELAFMLPAIAAEALGRALLEHGQRAAPGAPELVN